MVALRGEASTHRPFSHLRIIYPVARLALIATGSVHGLIWDAKLIACDSGSSRFRRRLIIANLDTLNKTRI